MTKPLKTLAEHNAERIARHASYNPILLNGIACPECGAEMYDEMHFGAQVTLTTNPPQKHIACSCGFRGTRIV